MRINSLRDLYANKLQIKLQMTQDAERRGPETHRRQSAGGVSADRGARA